MSPDSKPSLPPPRLDLGLPVRNGERFLREALACLHTQTFTDWRLLISDNASDDATESICRDAAAADPRIRYHRHAANIGASPNFNFCFTNTSAPLFKWMAHDDTFSPTFLEKCIARLEADPALVLAHSYTNEIDERGNIYNPFDEQMALLVPTPSARLRALFTIDYPSPIWGVMRRQAVARTRLYGSYLGSDWNFLAEMLLQGSIGLVPEYLFNVRNHETGFSFGFQAQSKQARLAWFDPKRRRPLVSACESTFHFISSVFRHPLPLSERLACLGAVAGRTLGKFTHKVRRLTVARPSAQAPMAGGAPEARS